MSAQVNENIQYTDPTTGELLVNGYIYVGLDGLDAKLNPASIYSDRDLTVALTNPQRTGSDGRSVNKIWIDGKYSLKVEDSANVQKLNDLSLGELSASNNTVLVNVQGADSITADGSPTVTALSSNQVYIFTAAAANTGAVTLTIDLTTTYPIKKHHDLALVAGDIEANQTVAVIWNSTDSVFELMTNSAIGPVNLAGNQTVAGNKTFSGDTTLSGTNILSGTNTISGKATFTNNAILSKGADIASASALTLGTDGNAFGVTGTTTITSIATVGIGTHVTLQFDGILTLTHHATDLILPGGLDITTSAGYVAVFYEYAAGDWIMVSGQPSVVTADGIKFPATQVPSADVNTLDDYEEGTWTPVLSDGTNNATSSVAVGLYTKVGNKVTVSCRLVTSSLGSVSGGLRITGLPFTSINTTNSNTGAHCCNGQGLAISAGNSIAGEMTPATAYINLEHWNATTGTTAMTDTQWTADGGVTLTINYYT